MRRCDALGSGWRCDAATLPGAGDAVTLRRCDAATLQRCRCCDAVDAATLEPRCDAVGVATLLALRRCNAGATLRRCWGCDAATLRRCDAGSTETYRFQIGDFTDLDKIH